MASPDGTSSAKRFLPPYLRADIQQEKVQIDAIIRATVPSRRVVATSSVEMISAQSLTARLGGVSAGPPPPLKGDPMSIKQEKAMDGGKGRLATASPTSAPLRPGTGSPQQANLTAETAPASPGAAQAKTQSLLSVVPSGVVAIGWFCETEFRATLFAGEKTWCSWYIESGPVKQYIGSNYGGTVYFLLNGQSYYLYPASLLLTNNSSSFRIVCEYSGQPLLRAESDFVHLDYQPYVNNNPCVSLAEASLVGEDSPCEVVGDNHGSRPRLRVVINHPAGITGQTVSLIMDDPHSPSVGRWLGADYLTIPHMQTSIEADGLIGTRKVLSKKTISVRARVNGIESAPLTIVVKRN